MKKLLQLLGGEVPLVRYARAGLSVFRFFKGRKERKKRGVDMKATQGKSALESRTVQGLLVTLFGGILSTLGFTLEEANQAITLVMQILGAVAQLVGLYTAYRGRKRATQPLA